jgi:hypothetical protein
MCALACACVRARVRRTLPRAEPSRDALVCRVWRQAAQEVERGDKRVGEARRQARCDGFQRLAVDEARAQRGTKRDKALRKSSLAFRCAYCQHSGCVIARARAWLKVRVVS